MSRNASTVAVILGALAGAYLVNKLRPLTLADLPRAPKLIGTNVVIGVVLGGAAGALLAGQSGGTTDGY